MKDLKEEVMDLPEKDGDIQILIKTRCKPIKKSGEEEYTIVILMT